MTKQDLRKLRAEAKRFIVTLDALIGADWSYDTFPPPRQSGAAKRASMDLTRALADYRQNREVR